MQLLQIHCVMWSEQMRLCEVLLCHRVALHQATGNKQKQNGERILGIPANWSLFSNVSCGIFQWECSLYCSRTRMLSSSEFQSRYSFPFNIFQTIKKIFSVIFLM